MVVVQAICLHEVILLGFQGDGVATLFGNFEAAVLVALVITDLFGGSVLELPVARHLVKLFAEKLLADLILSGPILLFPDIGGNLLGDVVPIGNIIRGGDLVGEFEILF